MHTFSRAIGYGLLAGAGTVIFVCSSVSVLQIFISLPDGIINAAAILTLSLASYISAYSSAQLCRSKGLIQGVICGTVIFFAVFLPGIIMSKDPPTEQSLLKLILCILSGAVGGIKGINTKKTRL